METPNYCLFKVSKLVLVYELRSQHVLLSKGLVSRPIVHQEQLFFGTIILNQKDVRTYLATTGHLYFWVPMNRPSFINSIIPVALLPYKPHSNQSSLY